MHAHFHSEAAGEHGLQSHSHVYVHQFWPKSQTGLSDSNHVKTKVSYSAKEGCFRKPNSRLYRQVLQDTPARTSATPNHIDPNNETSRNPQTT